MAAPTVIWHGTQRESSELLTAISHNCTCEFGLMGVRTSTCVPHRELTTNQRWLDGLIFARRLSGVLLHEEGVSDP